MKRVEAYAVARSAPNAVRWTKQRWQQTSTPIEIHTAGGVESDREVRIVVPPVEQERRAVEIAVFRALLEISGQDAAGSEKPAWWRRLIPRKNK